MPSIVTHHIFANEVLNKLDKNIQNNIKKDTYEVFAQSFDNFYFYNFLDLVNGPMVRKFGNYCHKNNSQFYFINIIKYIKEHNLEENKEALGYLYGSITHYVLDSICHPFIFYKTGCFYKERPETYKYRGMHTHMEKHIDAFYCKYYYKKMIYKLNIRKEIIKNVKFSKELVELMNDSFDKTFHKKNMGNYYVKSYNNSKLVTSLFIQDKKGIKLKIYKFIDLFNKKNKPLAYYSNYIKGENLNYLNIERKEWIHPCDDTKKSNESFMDLYNRAIIKATKLISEIDKTLNTRSDITKLVKVIDNLSYTTGLPIEEKNKGYSNFEY